MVEQFQRWRLAVCGLSALQIVSVASAIFWITTAAITLAATRGDDLSHREILMMEVQQRIQESNRAQDGRLSDLEKRSLEVNSRQDERVTRIEERQIAVIARVAALESRLFEIFLAVLAAAGSSLGSVFFSWRAQRRGNGISPEDVRSIREASAHIRECPYIADRKGRAGG